MLGLAQVSKYCARENEAGRDLEPGRGRRKEEEKSADPEKGVGSMRRWRSGAGGGGGEEPEELGDQEEEERSERRRKTSVRGGCVRGGEDGNIH